MTGCNFFNSADYQRVYAALTCFDTTALWAAMLDKLPPEYNNELTTQSITCYADFVAKCDQLSGAVRRQITGEFMADLVDLISDAVRVIPCDIRKSPDYARVLFRYLIAAERHVPAWLKAESVPFSTGLHYHLKRVGVNHPAELWSLLASNDDVLAKKLSLRGPRCAECLGWFVRAITVPCQQESDIPLSRLAEDDLHPPAASARYSSLSEKVDHLPLSSIARLTLTLLSELSGSGQVKFSEILSDGPLQIRTLWSLLSPRGEWPDFSQKTTIFLLQHAKYYDRHTATVLYQAALNVRNACPSEKDTKRDGIPSASDLFAELKWLALESGWSQSDRIDLDRYFFCPAQSGEDQGGLDPFLLRAIRLASDSTLFTSYVDKITAWARNGVINEVDAHVLFDGAMENTVQASRWCCFLNGIPSSLLFQAITSTTGVVIIPKIHDKSSLSSSAA